MAENAQKLLDKVTPILHEYNALVEPYENLESIDSDTAAEMLTGVKASKSKIIQIQKRLKALKKEANDIKKRIRSSIAGARAEVSSDFVGLLAGKKAAGKVNAAKKEDLRRDQGDLIAPFDQVIAHIDSALLVMDDHKGRIDVFTTTHKPAPKSKGAKKAPKAEDTPKVFVLIDDEAKGPYSFEQLQPLLDIYVLVDETLVCEEGAETWVSYGAYRGS